MGDPQEDKELDFYRSLSPAERERYLGLREREIHLREREMALYTARQSGRGCSLVGLLLILGLLIVAAAALVVLYPGALMALVAQVNPAPHQTETAVAAASQTAARIQAATLEANMMQITLDAVHLQNTQLAIQNTRIDMENTHAALQWQGTRAALDNQVHAIDQTATAAAHSLGAPPPTWVITAEVPDLPIDDYFNAGINDAVWRHDPARWLVQGTALTALEGSWLLSQRADFEFYTLMVTFTPPSGARSDSYILLNVREGDAGQIALHLGEADGALADAGLYYFTHSTADGRFAWEELRPVPNGQTAGLSVRAPSCTVRVEVRRSRFAAHANEIPLIDLYIPDASTGGAVGVVLPTGAQLDHIRVTPQ